MVGNTIAHTARGMATGMGMETVTAAGMVDWVNHDRTQPLHRRVWRLELLEPATQAGALV